MTAALVLGALLAVAVVLFVARPFLREPAVAAADDALEELDADVVAALEERDRALAALKELEFDHRTGKVSDEDYRALVGPLRRDAARALRALDAAASATVDAVMPLQMATPEPPIIPEPSPVPHEPPRQPEIPEPYPPPSTPPAPVPVPEPAPAPHEPPQPGIGDPVGDRS